MAEAVTDAASWACWELTIASMAGGSLVPGGRERSLAAVTWIERRPVIGSS